jgi:hypothetical protein
MRMRLTFGAATLGAVLGTGAQELIPARRMSVSAGPDLDCATRVPAICPITTAVLATSEASGTTVRRNCRSFAVTSPGDVRPGCDDRLHDAELAVGLVSCGG